MKLLSRSASILAGVAALAAFTSSPAKADSSFSATATLTTPGSYTQSISAELTTSTGVIYGKPAAPADPAAAGVVISPSAVVNFTVGADVPVTSGTATITLNAGIDATQKTSVQQVVAEKLGAITTTNTAVGLEEYTSILKAAAGADGLE
ncbi:hypothetical protein IQ247_32000 [Plectonema cf. radiosum LEGE 06105]|uniref:Uncharacterized protein n=1 Tax=Plectonema cf. radiosum LEGE 06105 TaxID=945769 RepID=A0A8J7K4J6_9CYAN|nr:hypothetical protein [Plectonema radiosum]MBE9217216.1 hypothetical protein [Plectonema cf. radiosum LEGE 06105]